MPFLADRVLAEGLAVLTAEATRLDICTQEPTGYQEATDIFSVGNKTGLSVGTPEQFQSGGMMVVVPSVADGDATASETPTHWALSDPDGQVLLAAGELAVSDPVAEGGAFSLPAFVIAIPAP